MAGAELNSGHPCCESVMLSTEVWNLPSLRIARSVVWLAKTKVAGAWLFSGLSIMPHIRLSKKCRE